MGENSSPGNGPDSGRFAAVTAAVKQYTEAIKESQTAAGQAADANKALETGLDGLKEAFPALGGLAKAVTSPLTGAVQVGIYLIKSTIAGIKQMMDSISEDVQFENLTEVFRRQKRALEDASTAAKLYGRELTEIASRTDTPTEAAQRNIETLKDQQAAQERIAESRKQAERAQVEATEINPSERARKLNAIEDRYAQEKITRDAAGAKAVLDAKKAAIQEEARLQEQLQAKLGAARDKQEKLGTIATTDSTDEADRNNLRKTEELTAKKQKRYDELNDKGRLRRTTPEQNEMVILGDEIRGAEGTIDLLKKKVAANEKLAAKRLEISTNDADIAHGEQQLKDSVSRVNDLQRGLKSEEDKAKRDEAEAREIANYDKSRREDISKAAAAAVATAAAAATAAAPHVPVREGPESANRGDSLKHYEVPRTSIEKMGFVFNNGSTTDHAAATAANTTKMVEQLGTLIAVTIGGKAGQAALTNGHAQ